VPAQHGIDRSFEQLAHYRPFDLELQIKQQDFLNLLGESDDGPTPPPGEDPGVDPLPVDPGEVLDLLLGGDLL
jgi:hypothetical protein